ncbi:MAG TPA: RluA family pseudouridine synthase [Polyangiaceae bacterium]|nr:RluA family pseudouridine synthase [Polyangiaceae bacterium]
MTGSAEGGDSVAPPLDGDEPAGWDDDELAEGAGAELAEEAGGESEASSGVLWLEAEASAFGVRVDKWLAERLPDVTRAQVQRWIDEGRVLVAGRVLRAKDKLQSGTRVEVRPGLPPATRAEPDASVRFDVLFEDAELIVVNKPAGLVVHPGRGHQTGTLVNGLLARPGFERPPEDPRDPAGLLRPGIVHRIDKDTSGVLVVAKTSRAREGLKEQFARHTIERVYFALTLGAPSSGTIDTLHGRDPSSRLRFTSRVVQGKRAVTHVRQIESLLGGQAAAIECRLETGRTHQIRVHLSVDRGTPLLADELYGGLRGSGQAVDVARQLGRQALHAGVLGFVHPTTGDFLRFEAPLPEDLRVAWGALGGRLPFGPGLA